MKIPQCLLMSDAELENVFVIWRKFNQFAVHVKENARSQLHEAGIRIVDRFKTNIESRSVSIQRRDLYNQSNFKQTV